MQTLIKIDAGNIAQPRQLGDIRTPSRRAALRQGTRDDVNFSPDAARDPGSDIRDCDLLERADVIDRKIARRAPGR